jgi:hypothetical protein
MKGIAIAEHVPDLTSKSDIQTINKLFNWTWKIENDFLFLIEWYN